MRTRTRPAITSMCPQAALFAVKTGERGEFSEMKEAQNKVNVLQANQGGERS
jgi:hypothetical protein